MIIWAYTSSSKTYSMGVIFIQDYSGSPVPSGKSVIYILSISSTMEYPGLVSASDSLRNT
jgi:hypothetical protein